MKILGSLNMFGNMVQNMRWEDLNEYPAEARIGSVAMVNRRLMLCIDVSQDASAIPFWFPLTQQLTMVKYHHTAASKTWLVEHNMNNSTPIVQVYDATGEIVMPDKIRPVDEDSLMIEFGSYMTGSAVIISGNEFGAAAEAPVLIEEFAPATQWTYSHNLGRVPTVRVYVNGAEVQAAVTATDTTVTVNFGVTSYAGKLVLF